MVSDRGRGVFELMAGQNAHDAVFIADDTLLPQELCARDARGAGRLATDPTCSDLCLRIKNLLIAHLADNPIANVQGPQAFFQVHRTIDLDGACNRIGLGFAPIELIVVPTRCFHPRSSAIPAQVSLVIEHIERVSSRCVDHCQSRHLGNQSQFLELDECFSKRAAVAQIPPWNDDPIGYLPTQGL